MSRDARSGLVSIVGAGPGDPDLLTCRAAQRLKEADLVLYDGLVPEGIVRLASAARHLPVSRRCGSERFSPKVVANLMIEAAQQAHQRVVRLRSGDPFVLARGAEEVLALVAANVPFEIVPGLTTALAAPVVAGIPLTHRGIASGFLVVSGHSRDAYAPVLSALPPNSVTVVALMGLAERAGIAQLLIDRGWRPETPLATVINASQKDEEVLTSTLESAAREHPDASSSARTPGVIVIGEVVAIGRAIAAHLRSFGQETLWQPSTT